MTTQEAVRLIKNMSTMCEYVDAYGYSIDSEPYFEAVNMAIEALSYSEKPNRSDLISRSDAVYAIEKRMDDITCEEFLEGMSEAITEINLLPSAQPEDVIHITGRRKFVSKFDFDEYEPERNKGEWIEMGTNSDGTHNIKCSKCGEGYKTRGHAMSFNTKEKYKHCPNCGADMRGEL